LNKKDKVVKMYQAVSSDVVGLFLGKIARELRGELEIDKPKARFYLLESSRILEKDKTFSEQDVTSYSEIVCVITEN
jgi:hypothetical protein